MNNREYWRYYFWDLPRYAWTQRYRMPDRSALENESACAAGADYLRECLGDDAREVRDTLRIGNELLVLAIGQLIPIKRFHLLVELLGKLPQPRPHLLILGEGPEENRLRELAARQGLEDRLHLTTTDNIAPWLAAADIYVSLSSTESWGMANCEALAAGLPAVCSAVGAVPEVVGDGAILVGESPDEMPAALARLVDSPAERALWAERARRQADQVALALENIFLKVPGR